MTPILIAAAIAIATALIAAAFHHVVQRTFGYDVLARHNDVAGFIYSAIGVIFAVVLGFAVIVVWQKYDTVRSYVDQEVAAATDLYHVADGFPKDLRATIRAQLVRYAEVVATREWRTMANGNFAVSGSPEIETIAHEISAFQPANGSQQDAHQNALAEVLQLFDARRQRIRANEPSVPPLLWFALFAGAAATLGFTYLFGVQNRAAQLLMTATLASLIAIMFAVIQGLDSPFSGAAAIQPSGWQFFLSRTQAINASDGGVSR
ncbi:MAG: DUF4239 domain-containing protein [Candidatus Eremiobacteraeota bacterium]|nr:DUF4239 domain-containing protein [Candidatus Eremiobacteraeota bacterium]